MMQLIPISNSSALYSTTLDGFNVELDIRYSKEYERWMMDVDNKTNNKSVQGVVMNVSIDLLAASNFLDLQVLMLINREVSFSEATVENLGTDTVLAYMDLLTYAEFYFDGSVLIRQLNRIIEEQPTNIITTLSPGQTDDRIEALQYVARR